MAVSLAACSPRSESADKVGAVDSMAVKALADTVLKPHDSMAEPAVIIPQAKEADSVQRLSGKFLEVVEGDYMHFEMQDASGKRHSFFTAMELPPEQFEPFLGSKMKGREVEVTWRRVNRFIPESEGRMQVDEVLTIKVLK
jgi:hypothetical protein